MSDRVTIVAESRTVTGKKVKQLRREGLSPALFTGNLRPVNIQMEVKPLRRALRVAGTTSWPQSTWTERIHRARARDPAACNAPRFDPC